MNGNLPIFPELFVADAMLHIALRRRPESDQGDALALCILRIIYRQLVLERRAEAR